MTDLPMLSTARLTLRPFTARDTDDLYSIRGDAEAMQFWDWPHDEHIGQTRDIVERIIEEIRSGSALYWTAADSKLAFAGVFDLSDLHHQPDLGFMVPRRLWGKGFGFEGANAIVAEAWKRGIPALEARVHEGNERSARLLTKLGFVVVGTAEPRQVRPGVIVACHRFRLLRPSFAAQKS